MTCKFCKRRIGLLRWVVDNEFCCREHRAGMRARSARSIRDQQDFVDPEEIVVDAEAIPASIASKATRETSTPLFLLMMGVAVGIGAIVVPILTSEQAPVAEVLPAKAAPPKPPIHGLKGFVRRHAAVRLSSDFRARAQEWVAPAAAAPAKTVTDGWSFKDGFARPGRFRIWQPSTELTDYQFEFAGQIEQKAMSWAWRANDEKNYYGSRLVVTRPGPLPEVQLMRWAKVDGEDLKRLTMRLPLTVRADTVYKVNVTLKGSDISMAINGLMVDSWTDEHFSSGGVAFFAGPGESSLLRYVTVTQRDTLLGRVLAYLGMMHPSRLPLTF